VGETRLTTFSYSHIFCDFPFHRIFCDFPSSTPSEPLGLSTPGRGGHDSNTCTQIPYVHANTYTQTQQRNARKDDDQTDSAKILRLSVHAAGPVSTIGLALPSGGAHTHLSDYSLKTSQMRLKYSSHSPSYYQHGSTTSSPSPPSFVELVETVAVVVVVVVVNSEPTPTLFTFSSSCPPRVPLAVLDPQTSLAILDLKPHWSFLISNLIGYCLRNRQSQSRGAPPPAPPSLHTHTHTHTT